jgi:hypothetical protein
MHVGATRRRGLSRSLSVATLCATGALRASLLDSNAQ